ncbi:SEFIR domain-containing protein [Nocardia asteroides]|uniref:SEFIR domain-containing protein n=1 Tax=Nocardia asteroides TaxID=1824 RepID=UPI001E4E91BA|nr:SEFIR domain-containing protein [Nocardia asteroides]UGT62494.1 TIR domain-containing protein [Nocardia asteroides]
MTDVPGGAAAPRVFVSYTHDDEQHVEAVRRFSVFLAETCGLDMQMDRWDLDRRRDWSLWARAQLAAADYVLIVASPLCRRVGDGRAGNLDNRGMQSELSLIRELLHTDRETWTAKLLPVVLPGHTPDELPLFLQPQTADHYIITDLTIEGADDLLRVLTAQPYDRRPDVAARLVHLPQRAAAPAAPRETITKGTGMRDNADPRRNSERDSRSARPDPWIKQELRTGTITAGKSVRINNSATIVNYARRKPLVVLAAIAALVVVGFLLVRAVGGDSDTGAGTSTGPVPASNVAGNGIQPSAAARSDAVTVDPDAVVGTWSPTDGSDPKTFTGNGSRCEGFYYNAGKPLDIGGPAYCVLSSKPDAQNRYSLMVTQSVNRAVYSVAFSDEDTATVYDSSGSALYSMSRF